VLLFNPDAHPPLRDGARLPFGFPAPTLLDPAAPACRSHEPMPMLRAWLSKLAVFWLVLCSAPTLAAPPSVESISPGIGPSKSPFVVTLVGAKLAGATDVLLYEPGLTSRKVHVVSDNEVRLTLAAAPGCRLGAHPFRLRTPGGLSELKVVHIGRFPVVAEVEPNDDANSAQVVPMNTTVTGVLDSGDVDVVAVELEPGRRLSAEVQAIRLGGAMTDTILTVFGPKGEVIATADDTPATRQDPFVSLVARAGGTYFIQLREASFGGGPGSTFALHVGDFPRPSIIFPPGGTAGKPARLTLMGVEGEPNIATPTLPAEAGPWWAYYPALAGHTAPTPTLLRVRPYHYNDEPDRWETTRDTTATAHEWPVAFHGAIGGPGDVDTLAIKACAGALIQVEAFAERIGSKLDTILEIHDPQGTLVSRNDDDTTLDSRLVFRANDAGIYRIQISDKRGAGGPEYVYRVEVEEPRRALTLFLPAPVRKSQERQVIAVPRGNRVTAFIGVRRDGFDAPVAVKVGDLPQAVTVDVKDISAETHLTPLVCEATADAPLGASLIKLSGIATTSEGTVCGGFRQTVDLVPGTGDSSYESIDVESLAVVVTEEAPYTVNLRAPQAALAPDGGIDLVATVIRAKGYDETVEVSLPYLPPGVEMDGPQIVPPGQSEVVLHLFARPDADPVSWRLAAEARAAPPRRDRREMTLALMAQIDPATLGGGALARRRGRSAEGAARVSSRFVALDVAAAAVSGRIAPSSIEQGKSAAVTCLLEPGQTIAGGAVATLEGLPPRATATGLDVPRGARQIVFKVSADPTTPVGEYKSLVCRLAGTIKGQPVVYRVGRGGLLKVHAPGAALTGPDGKPLSPLELLRLKERAAPAEPTGRGKS
jgi:hypothetical protein